MKNRFNTIDVMAAVNDLKSLEGMHVNNIYDINSKTYLIRLQRPNEKATIIFESGIRIHRTWIDWPKSQMPSSFSMKMRKHVKNKRLDSISQVGVDRIIDMQFGGDDRAVHVIVELYDRGNILLTDHSYVILNILRPRTDKDTDVKLSVKETYPVDLARTDDELPSAQQIMESLSVAKKGDNLRRILAPLTQLGGPLIDHSLSTEGFSHNAQIGRDVEVDDATASQISKALGAGKEIYNNIRTSNCRGYITYKEDTRTDGEVIRSFQDYHPYPFSHVASGSNLEFQSFSEAVDEFYSKMDEQKQEQRVLNMEKDALKKLDNVRKDQEGRVQALEECQERQKLVAERIIVNKELVERALMVIRSAIANQLTWDAIDEMRVKAAAAGDPVAGSIVRLNLDSNQFVMRLRDPFDADEPSIDASIDVSLNSFQNSRRFFSDKKAAAEKAQKTLASAGKAIKNAQLKTKETLDQLEQVRIRATRKRKPMWFEKFLWFISSENYIVVAGRDAQQNELLVKKYLRDGDLYMHADIRGAASIVIRNKTGGGEIPPKTLTEAAQMAVCYSNAWEAKVVANAWWVRHDQVSRSAPTGEYLSSGSFMIRGKKNYLPASQLVMGFGILFRVDEESAERHKGERKVLDVGLDNVSVMTESVDDDIEVPAAESDEDDGDCDENVNEDENDVEFPDVQVDVKGLKLSSIDEEYSIIEIGQKGGRKPQNVKQSKQAETEKYLAEKREEERKANAQKMTNKRQKYKQKKMKKYEDQDEEEREMRMQLLGSRGKPKEEVKPVPVPAVEKAALKGKQNSENSLASKTQRERPEKNEDDGEDKEEEIVNIEDSEGFLDQLTGKPVADDALLFAVPVVAPYQVLTNYKYKVKLTPGTGKRGKAAKSALELFMRMKIAPPAEDGQLRLLVGDEATARNIPGKVRVSAPQLHAK